MPPPMIRRMRLPASIGGPPCRPAQGVGAGRGKLNRPAAQPGRFRRATAAHATAKGASGPASSTCASEFSLGRAATAEARRSAAWPVPDDATGRPASTAARPRHWPARRAGACTAPCRAASNFGQGVHGRSLLGLAVISAPGQAIPDSVRASPRPAASTAPRGTGRRECGASSGPAARACRETGAAASQNARSQPLRHARARSAASARARVSQTTDPEAKSSTSRPGA